ncbi:N-acetylneuraminate synthase family protein [bacterium]|nr:N-acetylneuraminate synthase family protein [bacterium]MBU1025885.1 N-acetylneuraminate synthase family protein [bacterium]
MSKFQIGNRIVASGKPVYFLAEIGLNHNGDLDLAKKIILAAKRAKADGVKFQTYKSETLADPDKKPELYEIFKTCELDAKAHEYLRDICRENDLAFISTPFDFESADMLYSCGVDAFKVASSDLTNYALLRKIASFGLPVIFSTGMGYMEEVVNAIDILKENGAPELMPLHCVSSYPPDQAELNMSSIPAMRETLSMDVGYSDHYTGDLAVLCAVTYGAVLIEKHFTLNKNLPGPDQRLSADEGELRTIVQRTSELKTMIGDGIKKPSRNEETARERGRCGLYASRDIPKGTLITKDDIGITRPQGEMPASMIDEVMGKTTVTFISKGKSLSLNLLKAGLSVVEHAI